MALRRYNAEAPIRVPLVDRVSLIVTLRWLQWFQDVAARLQAVSMLDVAYDPPSLGAGAVTTVNVAFKGARAGDFVTGVSFAPMAVGGTATSAVRLMADVTDVDQVSVTFFNVTGGAVDLDAGTLRILVERAA